MSIPAIGPITARTWALEIGEVQRFSPIKKAISCCGLYGDEQHSANSVQRTPISKQRNKRLQTTLIEAAKMAPRYSSTLAQLYDRELQKGNANRATLAVARKLVAYLMAVDRGQTHSFPRGGCSRVWTHGPDRALRNCRALKQNAAACSLTGTAPERSRYRSLRACCGRKLSGLRSLFLQDKDTLREHKPGSGNARNPRCY